MQVAHGGGSLRQLGGPDARGHDRLAASWERQLGPGCFRKGVCPGQVLGVSSGVTPTSTSPVLGAVRDEGEGRAGGRVEGEEEEELFPGRKASCRKDRE